MSEVRIVDELYAPNQQLVHGDASGPAEEGDGGSEAVDGDGGPAVDPKTPEPQPEPEPEPEPEPAPETPPA